jgi:DNA invertase Pin-like site-specific DNA recombinase
VSRVTCEHRRCCNERHLKCRPQSEHHGGSANGRAKLTEAQIPEIRALLAVRVSQQAIADRYGVNQTLISMIKREKIWTQKHQ